MLKTVIYTLLSLLAFAGNSILCRLALNDDVIDAASFTSIRLVSGAVFLLILLFVTNKKGINLKSGNWPSALYLFLYACAFSYAYITLETGIGALILFGIVQVTMIVMGILKGTQLQFIELAGLIVAFLGLALLLLPGASAPSIFGLIIMAISGIAWGFYTLAGKGSTTPLVDTANNFLRTIPFIIVLLLFSYDSAQISHQGIILAVASGAITSGLGYSLWYSVLPRLNVTQAAVIQLTVPIIAIIGGVVFSHEVITLRLIGSSILVLGGVLMVVVGKRVIGKLKSTNSA